MQKRLHLLVALLAFMVTTAMAQITTSSVSGKITANGEDVIGATIKAVHQPSGTVYRAVTNIDGRYSIQGMRPGGPYVLEVTYVGYKNKQVKGISLSLGQNTVLNETLSEDAAQLEDVVIVADRNNNMRTDRAGATTSINADQIEAVPTVSRSMNDLLKLTPQGANVGSGFSVGGGNYRQSYVTVDGAAFNNAFGIGGNLPGNGSPISLDALDQISVSSSPYDVRLSGFTGGAISAVTKSGTNQFKGTAYMYTTNSHLRGNKVSDYELNRLQSHSTTWGASFGGPIIKDKLFFFANGEYQSNISAGPSGTARVNASDEWSPSSGTVHRPLQSDMDNMLSFLNKTYGYNPGRYQGYSLDTPSYKFLARIDWNINENNKLNFRFSKSHDKDSSSPSSSTTPFKDSVIYPGGEDATGGKSQSGRTANSGLYFESARYYQEKNFTSFAAEWNSKWGGVNNVLRATYSYQDEPRTYVGGMFPTVDILKNGSYYMGFGPDPFTEGNLRQVKTFVATDEATWSMGIQNFTAGLQFETNKATNGFGAASAGYYVFESMDDFMNGKAPRSYGVTFPMDGSSQFQATMKYNQFSAYVQDQVNFSDRFRLTAGLRFELPIYPELENCYNKAFAALKYKDNAGNEHSYSTDQLPDAPLTVSPRVGFNWDILGNHKLVLRGGTGYFVGRLPFVWLVSAVSNAGCGQYTYYYNTPSDKSANYLMDKFYASRDEQVKVLQQQGLAVNREDAAAPSSPTIIDKDLKMNATWKTSLALDAKLPYDVDFSLEGIYSREFNPATVINLSRYWDGKTVKLAPGDERHYFSQSNKNNPYMITNAGHKAYYYSITASLAKKFDFGLNLSASYTYSKAKSYGDGVGDQVSSAYYNNRYSVNGNNDMELGYGTYVAPNRLLISASYKKDYGKNFGSEVGLIYEGMNMGYADGYSCTRYTYQLTSNVVGDYGSNGLVYIPASREALNEWNFKDNGSYTAEQQKDDFWAYINQDDYLKNHKGEYAERGGAVMPWHHQLDFKFNQNFYLNVAGQKNTLQFGVDIKNLANLLNNSWGLYKAVNNTKLLKYTAGKNGAQGSFQFQKNGKNVLSKTYTNNTSFNSTYSIQFSIRYIFN
ncbi:TonB-dependent receptor [Segatella copri]|uniref:TonB-dependent receptor n=1 Tax=Segatella copri TaxID=165179 RepID=UPI001C45C0F0|nr:TonB-dependent receptor [Segatella copri]MBW0026210.1 carboxypeptidase regulatory-like domain-containing protein [Segatella copri]